MHLKVVHSDPIFHFLEVFHITSTWNNCLSKFNFYILYIYLFILYWHLMKLE